jgi:UDP-glucose 4-epimerase
MAFKNSDGQTVMRILVTGGSGFLGSHIVEDLADRGHDVISADLYPPTKKYRDIEYLSVDVCNFDALSKAVRGCDAIYNCAGIADLENARLNPRRAIEVNILGTLNVIEAASEQGVGRLLQASSVYVFSRHGSVYRTTKQASENLIQDLCSSRKIDVTILRFGSLYGPRADAGNAIRRLATQAVQENRMDFWGDGTEVREYIHIRDAASLAADALDENFINQSLHITGHERVTTLEILETINEMLGGSVAVSLEDKAFSGRYRLTPYSFESNTGKRMIGSSYVDLGLGLLEVIRDIAEDQNDLT